MILALVGMKEFNPDLIDANSLSCRSSAFSGTDYSILFFDQEHDQYESKSILQPEDLIAERSSSSADSTPCCSALLWAWAQAKPCGSVGQIQWLWAVCY